MFELDPMVTSLWAYMASWLTPTILFCFLNLMIATIYLASSTFKNHHSPSQLARAPSLLNRVKSINFPFYNSEHHYPFSQQETHHHNEEHSNNMYSTVHHSSPSQLVRAPSLIERVKSINFSGFYGQERDYPFPSQSHFEEPTNGSNNFSSSREDQYYPPSQLVRPPSLLERVRSLVKPEPERVQRDYPFPSQSHYEEPTNGSSNFSSSREDQYYPPSQLVRPPSLLERVKSLVKPEPERVQTKAPEPQTGWFSEHHVTRSQSYENHGAAPAKVSKKMKKSASQKTVATKREDDVERRRPATVREGKEKKDAASSGDCVDAKADDFINKFKQQLKLQRLDSFMRYKEMLGRGT